MSDNKFNEYKIISRVWVRSDGGLIREWQPDEYAKCDPHENKKISMQIAGLNIDVEAHCLELREAYAVNKQGQPMIAWQYTVDYSEPMQEEVK